MLYMDNTGENYSVLIGSSGLPDGQPMVVVCDSVKEGEVSTLDFTNSALDWIYQDIFGLENIKECWSLKFFFCESDFIFEEYPEKTVKQQFVFLQPGNPIPKQPI